MTFLMTLQTIANGGHDEQHDQSLFDAKTA